MYEQTKDAPLNLYKDVPEYLEYQKHRRNENVLRITTNLSQ